ncbi:MAG: DUF1992 domain-containing protein [Betaproteobacteria bacterium]|nr:MAG: DUF1992 domain-containing protein [Betaproteobacteria bacterium]
MDLIDRLVEQKISEAIARGELSGLPGEGAPLELDDDVLIPEQLRMAYRILRNAGFVPPEVAALREIGDLERRIEELPHDEERVRALRKLQYLRLRLEASGRLRHVLHAASAYSEKLLVRLQEGSDADGGSVLKGRS